ncbi:MAG TPA: hypothetical protein PK357_01195 [Candidatus Pacearchaeota archaeon]|nr:hypothetical protein [Candidatus Pacearchaeota archaeon]
MIKEKDNKANNLIVKDEGKKYFKKAFIYGNIGVGIGIVDYILSSKLGVDSIFKSFNEMNPHEVITNLYSGLSSIVALSGGVMYCISCLFEPEEKNFSKKEVKELEKKLKY